VHGHRIRKTREHLEVIRDSYELQHQDGVGVVVFEDNADPDRFDSHLTSAVFGKSHWAWSPEARCRDVGLARRAPLWGHAGR